MSDYFQDVERASWKWNGNVLLPYAAAYNTSYKEFNETINKQAEATKQQMEMFCDVVMLLSTSVMMASFAEVSLARLAVRSSIRALGVSMTRRVVQLVKKGEETAIVSMTLEGAYDKAKDKAKDAIKELMARLVSNTADGLSTIDPFNRDKQLQELMIHQKIALTDGWDALARHGGGGPAETALRTCRFLNPPVKKINEKQLALRIKLLFFMRYLLDSDYVEGHSFNPWGGSSDSIAQKSIDELPSSPKYPKPMSSPYYSTTIEQRDVGSIVRDAIDETHRGVFGKDFYSDISKRPGYDMRAVLLKAEETMRWLADKTSPGFADEVAV